MAIKLFWWRGDGAHDPGKQNIGDYLSPLIVNMVSGKQVVYADPHDADMIAIGSILSRERKAKRFFLKRRLHIWGSGTDRLERQFSGRHHYHAVRGSITLSQIQHLDSQTALGDPGLLVDRLWAGKPTPAKQYRVGIMPHFVDQEAPCINALLNLEHSVLINVFWSPHRVVETIRACDFILSSSMHGLVIADSFGIPNRRLLLSQGIVSDLKFDDYYSAFNISTPPPIPPQEITQQRWRHPVFVDEYLRPGLEQIKDDLTASFPTL